MEKIQYQPFEEKFKNYLSTNGIEAEVLNFESSCHSVEEASKTLGANPEDFIKNICLIDHLDRLVIAIVLGNSRVSRKKLSRALGINMPEFATIKQVEDKTGYPLGGVPPFGYEAVFVIDQAVLQKPFVYTSGGSPYSLTKIAPQEIYRINKGLVTLIGEKER